MAKLYFRYGAMNCGKTALLLQAVHNYEARGMKVLVLKPIVDSKGGKTIVSRIGLKREVDHLIKNTEDMFKYLSKNIINISCIFIDEAQFLKRKQVDDLLRVVVTYDIPIICYGLRTDFKTNGFEGSTRLLELAHSVEEMKTMSEYKDIVSTIVSKSDWKQMIDLNAKSKDNYNEIIKVYPDIKYGSYRNERSKKKLS